MKLVIVSGSQRQHSESAKVAAYIASAASQYKTVQHIELCKYQLPFWNGDDESKSAPGCDWPLISEALVKADAFVLITPEWEGMATPILKNFLMMCAHDDTAHKPTLLVSVVSGISGGYPIAELRMNGCKNNKLVAIPDHLIIRNVGDVLNASTDDVPVSERDQSIQHRIGYSLHILHQYSHALGQVRQLQQQQPYAQQDKYSNAM
ncbi:NAD(P)H-dependent oxidoreductase [Moritella sp. Urea-trap-13]|uniref:NAD(P)H-dependent oxidoreductase n=1 Tax=Moritella sp. Urea-trap-13 TaxID=2058327 RepID=UPI000C33F476|nr:NAD(P)H-dependent oxidoreductase [Moritella sp. Urea-trap-13]PKH07880.1 NADPH-dependent oxidoreductase [Moritella sp. Urea-trap-13]